MGNTKLQRYVQQWGLRQVLYVCLMRRLKPFLTLCYVYVEPLQMDAEAAEAVLAGTTRSVRLASDEELKRAALDPRLELDLAWLAEARSRGDVCTAVFEGERMLSYIWATRAPNPHENGLWVHFDPRQVYAYKAYTAVDCRRQRLQVAARQKMTQLLQANGFEQGVAFVETHNLPSLAAPRNASIRPVGLAGYVTLLGRTTAFRSPGCKRAGFNFVHHPSDAIAGCDLALDIGQ